MPDALTEIRKIRDEIAKSPRAPKLSDITSRLLALGISVSPAELPELIPALQAFSAEAGQYFVPQVVIDVIRKLLYGHFAENVCDPWAGLGTVVAAIRATTRAKHALAITRNEAEAALGRVLTSGTEWLVDDPLEHLSHMSADLDAVASVPPFHARYDRPIQLASTTGEMIAVKTDMGNLILALASQRLRAKGIGLFVVPASFFFSKTSVLSHFPTLGLAVEAALALPAGAFAPYASISTYLLVVRRYAVPRMFVAQLSGDAHTNSQIVDNLKAGRESASLELGRFVDASGFRGIAALRLSERLADAQKRFGAPPVRLAALASAVRLGRFGPTFSFQNEENAVYVPLIGNREVVDSIGDLSLKLQNYAQVVIDPLRSDGRFVARFLNSQFGKDILDMSKAGFIPKLNKQSLLDLNVFIPDLQTQRAMLELESQITAERNTLLGLQNEIGELERVLWSNPRTARDVDRRVRELSTRLSAGATAHAVAGLDQWFETLPFPLASILRAWQATDGQDFKTRHEHLLHFFEATAEFLSTIVLSAFASRDGLFGEHREKLVAALKGQNLSFQRATFGTWKLVFEYLSKQTRQLLAGGSESTALCADMFADVTLALPAMLARKELVTVLSATNKMRNEWTGHGGVVSQPEAEMRNGLLLSEVEKVREAMADVWNEVQLVSARNCRPRRGLFENEIALLVGSNSEFLKETREMSAWLDVESLYLVGKTSARALQLLPFVQVGASPLSAKNACYFFNRVEKDGLRFVSYHFADRPERKQAFEQATIMMEFLGEV